MSNALTIQIIKHIMFNIGVIKSNKIKSILDKEFLLNEKIKFDIDQRILNKKIWGCQININDKNLKILVGDCSIDQDLPKEYCMIIHLTDSPIYGLYLSFDDQNNCPLIACNINKEWMQCNVYLQATLLAAMEQVKDCGLTTKKCIDYALEYNNILSLIKYHSNIYEEENEG